MLYPLYNIREPFRGVVFNKGTPGIPTDEYSFKPVLFGGKNYKSYTIVSISLSPFPAPLLLHGQERTSFIDLAL